MQASLCAGGFVIKIDEITKQLMEKLNAKLTLALKETPKETCVFTAAEMDTQLDSGMGLDKPLKKYSEQYKKFKVATGRTELVNHTFTSQMRNSMQVIDRGETAEIVFGSGTTKAYHTNKLRKWIGLGNIGANKVAKAIADLILKRLKK